MKGPLDWSRWALKMGELHNLSDGEARVLSAIAPHVDREGVVGVAYLTQSEIGLRTQRSERTVRRIIAKLRRRGLVSTKQRGREVVRYQLHDVLPVEQPSLFDRSPVTGRPTGQPDTAVSGQTGHLGGRQGSFKEVAVVVGAHEDDRAATTASEGVVDARYALVAEILTALPEPYRHFEAASVESALRAYPDRDAVAAAHIVASRVHGGQTHTAHVNTLLMGVLARMKPTPSAPAGGAAPPTAGQEGGKWWDGALAAAVEGGRA